jgi:hypothetical protein
VIHDAIQAMLDAHGDGWHCAQYVVCMGLERVNADGEVESLAWLWAPSEQPDWQTDGLLDAVTALRHSDIDD